MKVFISWSGQTSKNIAEIFRQWIPSVIQSVKPYYSPDDITKGTRWGTEIAKELDESKIGIICLTKDNLQSPWIMFEAGALSKNIDTSKVCPLLFDVDPTDIQGPLIQFQAAKFTKEEMKKVVKMMNNELGELALATEVFENVFEMWWPKLNEKIESELIKPLKSNGKEVREERDILEEILTLTRGISITRERVIDRERNMERENNIHPQVIEDLVYSWSNIISAINQKDNTALIDFIEKLSQPLGYLINKADLPRSKQREYLSKFEDSKMELETLRIKPKKKFVIKDGISDESPEGLK
jgi:hypothetical protein